MTTVSETIGWIVATFAALGIAVGFAGYVSVSWGHAVFVTNAGGADAQRFGELFLSVVFFQNVSVLFFLGIVVSLIAGLVFGSRSSEERLAVLATGAGGFVGFYAMVLLAFVVMSLGMNVPRGFGFAGALGPIALAGIPAGIVGAIGGYFGWMGN